MDRSMELKSLEQALLGVIAAITQTPSSSVRKARLASNIATAKITGVATSASIFGLVSTLGTAGTGTAIGTLSGAAATNATLAWVGGLVGGGMAAGALLLPAAGIAAGAAVTMALRRKFHGRPRKLSELLPFEDEILFSVDNLIRPLDSISKGEAQSPNLDELRFYAHDGLNPLLIRIHQHLYSSHPQNEGLPVEGMFRSTMKPKYQRELEHHYREISMHAANFSKLEEKPKPKFSRILSWIKRVLANLRRQPPPVQRTSHLSSVVMAVTFQRLLEDKYLAFGFEQDLVLDALRRSTKSLEIASVEELSQYVKGLSPEQLRGVVSNTKGIYHEMLFVEMYNSDADDVTAKLMEQTNYPGADVQFFTEGEVIREVQLKAISSPTLVYEHLRRYPDIEILATDEVAAIIEGVDSSGLTNATLSKDVIERMHDLEGQGLLEEISDGMITSAFVTSGFLVYRILQTQSVKTTDFKPYLANAGIAIGTASLVEGALSVAGN